MRSAALHFLRGLTTAVFLMGSGAVLLGQTPDRVPAAIDSNVTTTLRGSANPHAAAQYDVGRMAPATPLEGVTIYFKLTAAQQAQLDSLVQAQQTPGSPHYHQWLTPQQYASRFGLSANDLAKVENWLQSQGFTVDRVANSRTSITFSGTAGQVEQAFGTEMHNYQINGERHFANATDLTVPAVLSGVVLGVRHLSDFRPRPMVRYHTAVQTKPAFTSGQTGEHFLTPGDVATIYDMTPAYNSGDTGTGETIVVVGQSAVVMSDIEAFQKANGQTVKDPTPIIVPNSGTSAVASGDESESDLDLEYSSGMAPGATIDFVYVGNNQNYGVFDAVQYAVDNDLGSIISMSYGACETQLSATDFSTLESIMQQGASQGQSILASSGDSGSTACYGVSGLTPAQQAALSVNYPASSKYVTGVGGTQFLAANVDKSNTQYWKSASGNDVVSSALSYIPELTWNDDSAAIGSQYGAQYAVASGGGGTSALAARPSWQTGVTGIPSGTKRLVPDLSLNSSADEGGYLYCTSDQSAWTTGQKASCNSGFRDSTTQDVTIAGGTSFAAPIFAGMLAIINQVTSSTQGVAASKLYSLAANSATYATAFHDITSGGNNCTAGSTYCSGSAVNQYLATTGYDEATGLGSVDFDVLLTAWAGGTTGGNLDATTTTVTPATTTPASGANDVITIAVAPSSNSITGTPTGTLTIKVDGTTETSSLALTSGAATYTFSSATAGTHTIEADYSGDSTFAASTGTATVTIAGAAGGTFTLAATNPTITQGSSGTSTLTVTPAGGYTGTVGFSITSTDTSLNTYGCYSVANATVSGTTAATTTLTIYTAQSSCGGSAVQSFARSGGTRAANTGSRRPFSPALPAGGAVLAGALLFGFRKSRKAWAVLGCLMLIAIAGLATGCGSNNGTGPVLTTKQVPTGSYTLIVTGTDTATSSLTAQTSLVLKVQ